MVTYFDKIIADHREWAKSDGRSVGELLSMALDSQPCRGFRNALTGSGVSIIAEIKRSSPSKGELNSGLDPAMLAKTYEMYGASCISVLTDEKYFSGSLKDLKMVSDSVGIPLLRKDFTVSAKDVLDAKLHGADAILLIVSALTDQELADFYGLAKQIGLDALVEVHDELELERAKEIGANLIGVNQRDLTTFEVDSTRAVSMAGLFNRSEIKVCESGISLSSQMISLAAAGYDAVLIGETLVRSPNPGGTLSGLANAGRGGL